MREKELSDKAEILDELKKSLEEDAGIGSLNYARKFAELRGRYSPSMVEELAGGVLGADEADKRIVVINKKLEELKKNINDTSRHQLERLSATRQLLQSANKEYVREYLSGQNQMNWWKWWVVESFMTKTQERLAKKELEEKIAVIERDLSVVNALENNHINKLEELLPAEQDPLIKGVLEGLRAKLGKFGKEAYQEIRKIEDLEITLDYEPNQSPRQNKAALEALSAYYKTELKEVSAGRKELRLLGLEKDLIFIKQYKQGLTDEQEAKGASDELRVELSRVKSAQHRIEQGLTQGKMLEKSKGFYESRLSNKLKDGLLEEDSIKAGDISGKDRLELIRLLKAAELPIEVAMS